MSENHVHDSYDDADFQEELKPDENFHEAKKPQANIHHFSSPSNPIVNLAVPTVAKNKTVSLETD